MTGAPIDATNTEVTEVAVEANYDEDITSGAKVGKINESSNDMEIDLEEEQNTEKYKATLNIDIENISKIENIHNDHKRNWMRIYKVIQQLFFDKTDIFSEKI